MKRGGGIIKVIFLDVDGELTYSGYRNELTNGIDPKKVSLLKKIVDATNAIIVLSSSWKVGFEKETGIKRRFYQVLESVLNDFGLKIFDVTPDIPAQISDDNPAVEVMTLEDTINIKCVYGTGRGAEVRKWIDDNKPESYVILDDENHDWSDYALEKNWIQPSWFDKNGGLHQEHVDKAIAVLNRL
ncbi:HAD domain-containing protein [Konateibacter massiliensis]|uniref:HAD domain-containing protein n=1 Tax=Konateibacter massiliensis TaxID=2002841 RepID=UPI000C150DAE|nr:HAD domain-containing protein [Konateibacter massiliensis]